MIIKVTQSDIDNGVKRKDDKCAIALAIIRCLKAGLYALVNCDVCKIFNEHGIQQWQGGLPLKAEDFIDSYDNGELAEPFEFELPIPGNLLYQGISET